MSWKQQKLVSLAAIAAALLVNCLPVHDAKPAAQTRMAAAR